MLATKTVSYFWDNLYSICQETPKAHSISIDGSSFALTKKTHSFRFSEFFDRFIAILGLGLSSYLFNRGLRNYFSGDLFFVKHN